MQRKELGEPSSLPFTKEKWGCVLLEVVEAFLGRIGIFADNEADVVSADGCHDLGDFQSIQDGAKGLGQAWQGFEDNLVLDGFEHD